MSVKVGFIGCGGIANAHMARLAQVEGVEFAGMCDVEEEKAVKAAQTYGGKAFKKYPKMLDEVRMDACFICVPPFAHDGQEELCLEKSIPFFVEKPIELNLDKAMAVARKVREKKLVTGVGYVLRYFDVIERAREILAGERIGLVRGKYFGCVPGGGKGWYSEKALSGGQLVEQATHTVDMMRYLVGDVEEVFGYAFEGINRTLYDRYDVEDASTTVLKFTNGVVGNICCTWLWTGYYSSVEVVCKDLIVTCEGTSVTVDRMKEKVTYTTSLDPMLAEDQAFIAAVREADPGKVKSDYPDACKSLAVSICALESFASGKPVKIPG